ncbi:MAG: class I SAM-dependent methyltransferase [Tannerella sp.]|nr:class I SAM-dependent methyltransferase [Tannerella sp.]
MNQNFEIKGRRNARRYRGNAVTCPCCGETFRTFMDFQCSDINNESRYLGYYENTVCPRCFSFPRHRIVCHYFDTHRENPENTSGRILMFGAEFSIEKWFRRHGYSYDTADLFDRTAGIKADIQNTLFPDESWSLIICNHVLEHVPDYKAALKELKRILKKGGILELSAPTDRNLDTVYEDAGTVTAAQRIERFGQADHLRIFGNDLSALLEDAGFSVEVLNGNLLPAAFRTVVGPANYDDNRIYICRKA